MAAHRKHPYKKTAQIVVGVLIVVWSLAPIYWAVVVAFSSAARSAAAAPPASPRT